MASLERFITDFWSQIINSFIGISDKRLLYESISGSLTSPSKIVEYATPWHRLWYGNNYSKDTYSTGNVYVLELDSIYLCGNDGDLSLNWRTPFLDSGSTLHLNYGIKYRRPNRIYCKKLRGRYFHLLGPTSDSMGHFMQQFVPRVVAAYDILKDNPEIILILSKHNAVFQRKYLSLIGLNNNVIEHGDGCLYLEKLIFVPPFHGVDNFIESQWHERFRTLAFENILQVGLPSYKHIFLSRKDAFQRRLYNEDAIFDIAKLKIPGLQRITLANLQIREQVSIFKNAEVLIGPIGQGFANTIFSNKCRVLCITEGEHLNDVKDNHCYMYNYHPDSITLGMLCSGTKINKRNPRDQRDYYFDEKRFSDMLDAIDLD
jgi:hypothetical protein